MRPLTQEQRKIILDLWLDGDSYRRINSKTGISIGAISKVISKERKKTPDIDQLRKISVIVKKSNSTILDTLRGANLLEKINSLDINLKEVRTSINLLEHYGDESSNVLSYAEILRRTEIARRKTYKEIINELNETTIALDTKQEKIKNSNRKIQALQIELSALEQLKALQLKLDSHSISHSKLDEIIESQLSLEKMGLTPKIADILAKEMDKTGETPANAARKIVHLLDEQNGLIDKNLYLSHIEEQLKRSIKALQSKEKDIEKTVNSSKETIIQYDETIQKKKKTYQLLQNNIDEAKKRTSELKLEKENLIKLLQIGEQSLYNIEIRANKNKVLNVIITLLADPEAPIDQKLLLIAMIRLNLRLMEHVTANSHIVSNPENLRNKLSDLMNYMGREYTIAK